MLHERPNLLQLDLDEADTEYDMAPSSSDGNPGDADKPSGSSTKSAPPNDIDPMTILGGISLILLALIFIKLTF